MEKEEALEGEAKAIEGELEALKEAAIAFAEKEDAQVIAGTDARLKVTGKDKVILPGKGSEEREALDAEDSGSSASGTRSRISIQEPWKRPYWREGGALASSMRSKPSSAPRGATRWR